MSRHTFLLFFSLSINAQEIPNEFFEFQINKLETDLGENWHKNSIFGPRRYMNLNSKSDSLIINARFGTSIFNDRKSLYAYGHFTFNKYFHGYLYPRIVDRPELFRGFSGIPRDIKRGGFNSGETDLSGISFENDWMIIQFGRGRQSWAAGNDIELAISEQSNPYDYGMLDLDFGKLKVRYFHGYLETDSLYINRYITGRGIEWNNQKNLLVGLSEIIIYSGKNRPIDFSYFNPMSTHLEIELNDRQNSLGSDSGNGIWQLSIDYFLIEKIRLSGNYLFDEFTIDQEQKDDGKGSGDAFSFKVVFTPIKRLNSYASCYVSIISVGTHTFKHEDGNNNFVQRNDPLGWRIGSDSRERKVGINWLYQNKVFTNINMGIRHLGENNFINNLYEPYGDYLDVPFPSGDIENIDFISFKCHWWLKTNMSIVSEIAYLKSDKIGKNFKGILGIDFYYGVGKN